MKIGLTGSIACGKSTVSQHLKQKGCQIVDADAISRALTAEGGAALPEIRKAFGDGVFSGAALDRAKLGQLVFADAQKRETLNAILHPMILAEIRRQLNQSTRPSRSSSAISLCCTNAAWKRCSTPFGWFVRIVKRRFSVFLNATD